MKKLFLVVALTIVLVAVLAYDGFYANGFDEGGRLPRVVGVSEHRGELVPDAGRAVVDCDGRRVRDGDDLAAAINSAPAGTTFCVEAGTYPLSETIEVQDGDIIRGRPSTVTRRGPAVDPDPVVHVRNAGGLARMFHVTAHTGRMEWLDIRGSPDGARYTDDTRETCENWGEASDRCPKGGTGVAIGAGESGPEFVFEHLQVHHNPAQCISGVKGTLLRSELYRCSQNADYWGYSAGALKTINEQESAYNFVHDNEAEGLWCDQGCRNNPATPEGWHQHDNLIVNNGRAGVRYEFSPVLGNADHARQPTALIEDNRLAGNGWGGVDVHDAQNATVRGNAFGPTTIAGTEYPHNGSGPEAMQFSESDASRSRTDLWNAEAYDNHLGGEAMDGCDAYTDPDKLRCYENQP